MVEPLLSHYRCEECKDMEWTVAVNGDGDAVNQADEPLYKAGGRQKIVRCRYCQYDEGRAVSGKEPYRPKR